MNFVYNSHGIELRPLIGVGTFSSPPPPPPASHPFTKKFIIKLIISVKNYKVLIKDDLSSMCQTFLLELSNSICDCKVLYFNSGMAMRVFLLSFSFLFIFFYYFFFGCWREGGRAGSISIIIYTISQLLYSIYSNEGYSLVINRLT